MYLQESSSAKNKRIVRKIIYRFFMITFTAMLYALDTYIIFGTGLVSISTDPVRENIVRENMNNSTDITGASVSFGPLFTNVCTSRMKCSRVLFYQVPDDKYFGETLSNILLATWIPLIIGLLGTRAMMYRVHPLIQSIISFGYIGTIYLVMTSEYIPGNTIYIMFARFSASVIFTVIIAVSTAIRAVSIKFCPDIQDSPILIGMSWNELDKDYSDDLTSQRFYDPKKIGTDNDSD